MTEEPAGAAVSAPEVSVLSDHCCHLGEGPTYDPQSDTLFWFDILERKLLARKLAGGETRIHDLPEMASALAVVDAGRQLVVTETGLHVRDARTGAMRLHTSIAAGSVALRSNDARVHPCGALWFSMMGRKAEARAGAIYWFFKGELRKLLGEITIPNSICFSPNGATTYYTDSRENVLWRVACDPLTGLPQGEPKVFYDHRGGEGGLDGSVVDAEGVLWNARWGAGSLDAYSPDGQRLRSIAMPARQVSCPAFVGRNADRIAVTSAFEGMDEAARLADPEAGKTFLVELPVKGRFEPRVML